MRKHKFPIALSIIALLLISPILQGCKGRTADNMEPTGDTVEVNIANHDDLVTALPDSITVPE